MSKRRKRDPEEDGDHVRPYVSPLDGMELPPEVKDSNGIFRLVRSEEVVAAICKRIIDSAPQPGDAVDLLDLEGGAVGGLYGEKLEALIYQASAALILSNPFVAAYVERVHRDGLDAAREQGPQTVAQSDADTAPERSDADLWRDRFAYGTRIIEALGPDAKTRDKAEALLRAGFECSEAVKVALCTYSIAYAARDRISAEILRKGQPLPDNLLRKRRGQFVPIKKDMSKGQRKRAMDNNAVVAAGDAVMKPLSPNARNRQARAAWGEGPDLSIGRYDDEGDNE